MILDNRHNIGQTVSRAACKILIRKRAPVAQWIERSPPKLTAARTQAPARARKHSGASSNKTDPFCAKRPAMARPPMRILDSY
jgi:hypothetical protein